MDIVLGHPYLEERAQSKLWWMARPPLPGILIGFVQSLEHLGVETSLY